MYVCMYVCVCVCVCVYVCMYVCICLHQCDKTGREKATKCGCADALLWLINCCDDLNCGRSWEHCITLKNEIHKKDGLVSSNPVGNLFFGQ